MGMLSHGVAVGIGYLLGRPDGRARLVQAGRQAADLAQRPEVVRLQERGKDLATNQAQAIKQKVTSRSKDTGVTGPDGADSTVSGPRHGLRTQAWRSRFRRSGTTHFPSSEEAAAVTAGTETSAVGEPSVAEPGSALAPGQEVTTSPADRS
jgi:hypothetical protein